MVTAYFGGICDKKDKKVNSTLLKTPAPTNNATAMKRIQSKDARSSILVPCRVVVDGNNKTAAFFCAAVYDLNHVNQLLFAANEKVDLVVVARAGVDHDMLVAPKEHERTWIIEFVHLSGSVKGT